MILSFSMTAQTNRTSSMQIQRQWKDQRDQWARERQSFDNRQRFNSNKPIPLTKNEIAQNKLTKEEINLEKLTQKSQNKEEKLKAKQEELAILDQKKSTNNSSELIKKIEKAKLAVTKAEEEFKTANANKESILNKIATYKKEIETIKEEEKAERLKQREERKVNKEKRMKEIKELQEQRTKKRLKPKDSIR